MRNEVGGNTEHESIHKAISARSVSSQTALQSGCRLEVVRAIWELGRNGRAGRDRDEQRAEAIGVDLGRDVRKRSDRETTIERAGGTMRGFPSVRAYDKWRTRSPEDEEDAKAAEREREQAEMEHGDDERDRRRDEKSESA